MSWYETTSPVRLAGSLVCLIVLGLFYHGVVGQLSNINAQFRLVQKDGSIIFQVSYTRVVVPVIMRSIHIRGWGAVLPRLGYQPWLGNQCQSPVSFPHCIEYANARIRSFKL